MSEYTVVQILDKKHKCLGSKKRCGVYIITNKANNKIYIGSSKHIIQRWRSHIRELENNIHKNIFFQSDWNEFGSNNFIFRILEECSEDTRYGKEQEYLNTFFPFYRSGTGYNISEKSTQRNEISLRLFKPAKDCLEDYYIVKAKGCRPRLMDGEHCRTTSREDLEDEYYALGTYSQIMCYIHEQNGYDDWE